MKKAITGILAVLLISLAACSGQKTIMSNFADMQYAITTPKGHRILVDTSNLKNIPENLTKDDVLVSTHAKFWDPFVSAAQCFLTTDGDFAKGFPGQKLDAIAGTVTLDDAVITAIPSSRRLETQIGDKETENFIIVVTTGGLKYVFLGFFGQESLTATQLEAVKNADFLFLTTFNQWGDKEPVSTLYQHWIDQINPRFIVPTVYSINEMKKLCAKYTVYYPGKDLDNLKLDLKSLSSCKTPAVLAMRSQLTALVKSLVPAGDSADQKNGGVLPGN